MLVLVAAAALAGCAGYRAYHQGRELIAEGKLAEGVSRLEEAVRLDPHNIEYRIALRSQREQAVTYTLLLAETARREGRIAEAEAGYRHVQSVDPTNSMAKQGLEALAMERRHRQIIAGAESELSKGTAADLEAVSEQLRIVLTENPAQPAALNLKARLQEARARRQTPAAELAAAYHKPITLEFHDAPLKTVFDAISKVSGINFFFDKDIRPDLKANVLARNTSIEDAIRLVLVTNQLEQKVLSPNSVLLFPNTPQKLKDYQTMSVRTFYLANADVKAISNTLKTILKTQDLITDERLGLIIMRDTPEVMRLAERLVALQDLADPEVMLDVEVLEIKRTRLIELGVSWPDQVGLSPLVASGQPLTLDQLLHLNKQTTAASINNATLTARHTDDNADLLANPRIRVRNKDTARVLIGDRVPVITTTSTSTGFVSDSVTYVDVGLKLEAEPNIYLDHDVAIKVHLEVSNIVKEVTSKAGTLAYQIGTRTADTVLRLKDGETQVLAGLIRDEDRVSGSRVPGLGSLPLLGRLFGSRQDSRDRGEIVLSITPHVLRSLRRPDLVQAEFESGTQSAIGARSLTFNTVEPEEGAAATPEAVGGTSRPSAAATDVRVTSSASMAERRASASAPTPESGPGAAAPPAASGTLAAAVPPTPATAAATGSGGDPNSVPESGAFAPPRLTWQLPDRVKAGEQFTALLNVTSDGPLRGLPLLIGFDPNVLQVVSVEEGSYLRQGSAATDFSHRADPIQGKVFVAAVRQNTSGHDGGVTGTGSIVSVTFKAVRASDAARIQLLSVSPEPAPAAPVSVPVVGAVKVVP
jgi:general secretion pathway protein D